VRRYEFHQRFGWLLVVVGAVTSVLAFALTQPGTFVTGPVLCLILGVIQLSVPLVVLEEDHFMARRAILAGARRILYRDVRGFEVRGKKLVVRVDPAAGDECVIAMNAFDAEGRERLERELASRTAPKAG
jgi:hypothetical protein